MPGSRWDPAQNINFNSWQVEWPQGPLDLHKDFVARWVEAWVVQSSTGASQRTAQTTNFAPDRWTADGIPPGWKNGNFEDGSALGIALLASSNTTTNTDEYFWWVDAIDLY
jgi:hypothetical protein